MRLTNLIRPVWKHGPRSLVLVQVTEKLKFFCTGNSDRVHRTTSFLTATMLAYTIGAGITAAAGTRLALQ